MTKTTPKGKNKLNTIILAFVLAAFLMAGSVHAATIADEDFNDIPAGLLSNDSEWTDSGLWQVQDSVVYEGSKAVHATSTGIAEIIGSPVATGLATIYFQTDNYTLWNGYHKFKLNDGSGHYPWCAIYMFPSGDLLRYYDGSAFHAIDTTGWADDVWHSLQIEWRVSDSKARYRFNEQAWTSWDNFPGSGSFTSFDRVQLEFYNPSGPGGGLYFDKLSESLYEAPTGGSMTIDSPESGTTTASTFDMEITYNLQGEDYQRIMVLFESWHASSTCPVWGTDTYNEEYGNDWFNYQSFPYYSDFLAATSTEATTTISVSLLPENIYNCVRCVFINSDLGTLSEEKCPDYTLTIGEYIPEAPPLPFTSWDSYYTENTDEKYPTSTPIFNTMAGVFENLYKKLTDFLNDFRVLFDNNVAAEYGEYFGEKIPEARGYLVPINSFLLGFPISELYIFLITISLIAIIFRTIKLILFLVRG